MKDTDSDYIPALRYSWLTSFYDPVISLTTREKTFKSQLIKLSSINKGDRIIDIGSGTGTLAIWLKENEPDARVVGLDGDPQILSIAKRKAKAYGLDINFRQGLSFDIPYEDETFNHCFSSLFFHHLTLDNKKKTFAEIFRVLKKGGKLYIADWGKPVNILMRILFYQIQLLDGFTTTNDNKNGILTALMGDVGFKEVAVNKQYSTIFGTMTLYSATKPM